MKSINDCWNKIGVYGNSTCQELPRVVHCHHCSVFADAGRELLDREPPSSYLEEWTSILRKEKESKTPESISVLIFRLSEEWFALETKHVREITDVQKIRALPHRKDGILLGIVNVHGELQLCVSLQHLLHLPDSGSASQRMVVMEKENSHWIFPVQEVAGLHRLASSDLQSIQMTGVKARFAWKERTVKYLDDQSLIQMLARSCS